MTQYTHAAEENQTIGVPEPPFEPFALRCFPISTFPHFIDAFGAPQRRASHAQPRRGPTRGALRHAPK